MSIDSSVASSAASASAFDGAQPGNLPSDHPLRTRIADAVRAVRDTTPLAQSFTNFVTINLVANAQLAVGGTAAMSFLPDDVLDIAAICGATYINVGTLLPFYKDALTDIAQGLHEQGKPWVLDPVAAGLGATRTAILESFRDVPPTVVRGNASEIIVLDRMWGLADADAAADDGTRPAGVESVDEVDSAIPAARRLARHLAAHDGTHDYRLPGGSALMTKITGAGCSLGGVVGTYLAVADPLTAAMAASLHFNRAGEIAEAAAHGPGSFQTEFLDALWNVTAEQIADSTILQ